MIQKTNKINTAEKIRKYAIVIFLTILVWAWAYNDLEEKISHTATLDIAKNESSDILVKFDRPTPLNFNIELKGTASKINNLSELLDSGKEKLDFTFNPLSSKEIPEVLDVLTFLRNNTKTRELGVSIESTDIKTIKVESEKLVKKNLDVEVLDINGVEVNIESIVPSSVDVFVRGNYTGPATITLNESEAEEARKDYIMKKPVVRLGPDNFRSGDLVKVKLKAVDLPDQSIQTTLIGYSYSQGLNGKYVIELLNANELKTTTQLKATQEAFDAYKLMPVQIFVHAAVGDENKESVTRDVIYNFPAEYESKGDIRLASPPRQAKFKLVPVQKAAISE